MTKPASYGVLVLMPSHVKPVGLTSMLPLLFILAACRHSATSPTGECSAPFAYAIVVSVLDSTSHALLADSAHGTVRTGAYLDSLHLKSTVLVGGNQLGPYDVTVDHPRYHQWTRTNVQVSERGRCGTIISVQLTALLQPAL